MPLLVSSPMLAGVVLNGMKMRGSHRTIQEREDGMNAQNQTFEEAIKKNMTAFADAWNVHDARAIALARPQGDSRVVYG